MFVILTPLDVTFSIRWR